MSQVVNVNQVTTPSNALNCTSTSITVSGINAGGGFTLTPITYSFSNDTIFVEVAYTIPQIYITVLTPWSHGVNLGNVPYGNWTVVARGYGNGSLLSSAIGSLSIGACCPNAIPMFQFIEDTVCAGSEISVINSSSGNNLSYYWEFEGGTSSASVPTFSIDSAGTYNVTLTVTGDSCSDSLVRIIEVLDLPSVDLGNDTSICNGDTLELNLPVGSDYLWSDGSTSFNNQIAAIGSISVTVTNEDGCVKSDTIAITGLLTPINVDLGPDKTVCPEEPVMLNAGSGGSQYVWSTGDITQVVSVNQAGLVSVTVSESGYCDGVDEMIISWHNVVAAQIELSEDSCAERLIWIDPSNHQVVSWSDSTNDTMMIATLSGYYYVTATDLNDCETVDSAWVQIVDNPIVDLGADTFLCGNQTITLTTGLIGSHLWKDGSTGLSFTVTSKGKYSVSVTDENGCTGADTTKVSDCLSLTELPSDELILYPNPTTSELFINADASSTFRIYEVSGRLVLESIQMNGIINVESLKNGLYFLELPEQNKMASFIKE